MAHRKYVVIERQIHWSNEVKCAIPEVSLEGMLEIRYCHLADPPLPARVQNSFLMRHDNSCFSLPQNYLDGMEW